MPNLLWFRQDLRLADNPALTAAISAGEVLPVYIHDADQPWAPGGAARWWLHHSLKALNEQLKKLGGQGLTLLQGDATKLIPQLVKQHDINQIFWNRCYEPHAIARDTALKTTLQSKGVEVHSFNASLLHEPWTAKTQTGNPFKVFTPFWKSIKDKPLPNPLPVPAKATFIKGQGVALETLRLLPTLPWDAQFYHHWTPGEEGARKRWRDFLADGINRYAEGRDRTDQPNTSRLSPHLHFGEISPRQLWFEAQQAEGKNIDKFRSELAWREFSYHLLYHFPTLPTDNFQPRFNAFPWERNSQALKAWQQGQTGYPIVDAGLRELWQTGYMHNRVRMIVGSFLVKHLRLHWHEGENWFWDCLVDADLANNAASWQWIAGCGADAAPYFRVFNPMLQGVKFDPEGAYVKRWVPELAAMPAAHIHAPWEAPKEVLLGAGVVLGKNYPKPIVDHATARKEALAAFAKIKVPGESDGNDA